MTFSHVTERFLLHLEQMGRSEATIQSYSKDVANFSRFLRIGHGLPPQFEDVRSEDIEAYLSWLRTARGYSPASVERHLHTLRSSF